METGKFLVDIGTRKQNMSKKNIKQSFPFKEISVPIFRTTLY